jgi:hypothetical protein
MNTESPLLEILLTRNEAKALLAAKPAEEERCRLTSKIAACDLALNFLRANSESASQMLMRIPAAAAVNYGSVSPVA